MSYLLPDTLPFQKSFVVSGLLCCDYMPCCVTLSPGTKTVEIVCTIFYYEDMISTCKNV